MADHVTDRNATKPNDQDQLRGGTQGGGAPPTTVGSQSGGTNSIAPAGGSQIDRGPASPPGGGHPPHAGGTRTESRHEPEELFEGSRKPSHATAKQRARDDADADTTHGLPAAPGNPKQHDETDPTGQAHSAGAFTTDGSLKHGGGHRDDRNPEPPGRKD
jgi:hypothetical protein